MSSETTHLIKKLKVFISSGEPSSDIHAAHYLKKLKIKCEIEGCELEAFGVGGAALKEIPFFRCLVSQEKLTAMGFSEVIGKIPSLLKILKELELEIKKEKPDFSVLFDYPEFHFKLALRIKKLNIPRICFIPPKVWVWRQSRLKKIKSYYSHVFTILPFETDLYTTENIPVTYIGNPLMDELPFLESVESCLAFFNCTKNDKILLLMPGSRDAELKYHLKPFLEAATHLSKSEALKFLIPLPHEHGAETVRKKIVEWGFSSLNAHVFVGNSGRAMKIATAAIIKSGTSTLEAALLLCPHVVAYDGHFFSKFLFKFLVRYPRAISLPNLIHSFKGLKKDYIVPELILEDFTVEKLIKEITPLLDLKSEKRIKMISRFFEIKNKLKGRLNDRGEEHSPLTAAAEKSFELFKNGFKR